MMGYPRNTMNNEGKSRDSLRIRYLADQLSFEKVRDSHVYGSAQDDTISETYANSSADVQARIMGVKVCTRIPLAF